MVACGRSMKRVGFLLGVALLGLGLFGCSKDAPSPQVVPPWQWAVTGMKPGSVASPPALVVCEANGSGCAPVKAGVRLSGSKLVRLERGTSDFELDSATHVELGEGSELLLQDSPRTLELRAGGISLTREDALAEAGALTVKLIDRTLTLVGRVALVARADTLNHGQLFVARGVVTAVEPVGVSPPVRQFHPGEGAVFERKAAPDMTALFAGKLSRFRQTVLAVADTSPPPASVTEPRGLGTMTARVPGTTAVVGGVRLSQHHVRAVVRDSVAQTEVEEVFQNDTDRVLEGRYVFPLPADATISGLTLFVGDKPVEGELVEKKRAAAIFQGIVEDTVRPRDPALLEWVSGSKFSLKVFPIPARGSRKLVMRYQQVLTSDGPRQAYVYPLSFGAERRTPIDELSLDVELSDGGQPTQNVVVSGYPAVVQPAPRSTRVTVRAKASAPDHDFTVSFGRATPTATVASSEQGFVAVRLRAELPSDALVPTFQPRDRVLVVDASQSQSAESFAAVKELALGMLRSLEPDEHFALLLCDSACDTLPKAGLSPATGQAVAEAKALLKARKPSGSSDLAGALRAAAERAAVGAPVQVVYVGDGAASAGELTAPSIAGRVRESFERRKVDLRLFGAGASVDEVTLGGLARALSGSFDNVSSAGPLAEQAEVLIDGLRTPLIVAPTLEAGDLAELEPRVLPNLRLGEELVVVGKRTSAAPFNVTLRGRLNGAAYTLVRPVAVEATPGALPFASRLWAQSRIRELETSGDPGASKQIVDLSKQFRVMSRETSWLVLESEQMFAEFGIKRSAPALDGSGDGAAASPDRAAQAQELDQLELGALSGSGAPSGTLSGSSAPSAGVDKRAEDSAKAEAPRSAPAPAAPSPAPPSSPIRPGASGGGLAGIGSTGAQKSSGADGSGVGAAVSGPKGNASVGGAVVSGGTVANAARVVAGMRAGFRNCYQRGLAENPDARGSLRLAIKVGPSGEVTNVTPSSVTASLSGSVVACVVARARAAQFDPPEGGLPTVVVVVTFVSQPGDPSPSFPPGALAPRPRFQPPDDVAVSRAGDESWLQQGQAALDKLQADLAASPTSRKRHEALVRGLLLRGRFAQALAAAERFVEVDPDLAVARELLAYGAVATGDRQRATAAVDALTEAAPTELKAQGRAARAFEALGDEARACAHWRSVFELAPTSDSALFEALRCRARSMGDREAALRDAKAVAKPGPLLQKLLPLLEAGQPPAFAKSSGSPGQFEVTLSCEQKSDCPYAIVITPTGTVFSPWTPALGRSSATSFAFSGLLTGVYRVLLVSGAPTAKGQVEVRALNTKNSFAFAPGHSPTIASTQVTMAPSGLGCCFGGGGISSLTRF
jgi:Vault protein inter-alpha-trypsin domain/von Willebrand factor type A domain